MSSSTEKNGTAVKKWEPKHEQMALLSASGVSNKEIAKAFGMTEVWTYKILADPRATLAKEGFVRDLRASLFAKYDDQILSLVDYALRNISRTVMADVDPEHTDRKRHQDKVSLEVIGLAGVGNQDRGGGQKIQLTPDQAATLANAIEKSDEAREINAEYEIMDAEPNGKPGA